MCAHTARVDLESGAFRVVLSRLMILRLLWFFNVPDNILMREGGLGSCGDSRLALQTVFFYASAVDFQRFTLESAI